MSLTPDQMCEDMGDFNYIVFADATTFEVRVMRASVCLCAFDP